MGATFGKQLYTEPYWDVIAVSGVTGVALGVMAAASKEVTASHTFMISQIAFILNNGRSTLYPFEIISNV